MPRSVNHEPFDMLRSCDSDGTLVALPQLGQLMLPPALAVEVLNSWPLGQRAIGLIAATIGSMGGDGK
jgi:hypothetical protein